jgi:hypothetical protein
MMCGAEELHQALLIRLRPHQLLGYGAGPLQEQLPGFLVLPEIRNRMCLQCGNKKKKIGWFHTFSDFITMLKLVNNTRCPPYEPQGS